MREREFDQLSVITCKSNMVWTCQNNGTIYNQADYTSDWVNGDYSRMIDDPTRYADNRTKSLNHVKTHIQSFVTDLVTHEHPRANPACTGSYITYSRKGRLGPGYHFRTMPWRNDSVAVNQACFEALQYFEAGCVDQEILLANFAWELPDVRNLWPSFTKLFTRKTRENRKVVERLKGAKQDVKDISGMYLGYQFGVLPVIGDIIRAYEMLSILDNHIKWLRKNNRQRVKVEFKKSLPTPYWESEAPVRPTSPPSAAGYWRKICELRAGFKAWAIVTYDVSELSDLSLSIKALTRAFGLNNPAGIVWEALPYSFVVDWFVSVGQLIDRLSIPIKLPMTIHDCGCGSWITTIIEDWYTAYGSHSLLRRTSIRDYGRRPGLNRGTFGLSMDTLSAKQITLGLALLGQKL